MAEQAQPTNKTTALGFFKRKPEAVLFISAALAPWVFTWVIYPLLKLVWANPTTGGAQVCPSRSVLGLPCPGCGMTRSFLSLSRFDFSAAFQFNPVGPLLWTMLMIWGYVIFTSKAGTPKWMKWTQYFVLAALIIAFVIRLAIMGPYHPDW